MLHDLTLCFLVTWPDFVLPVLILPNASLCYMTWPYVFLLPGLTLCYPSWLYPFPYVAWLDLMFPCYLTWPSMFWPDMMFPYVAWPCVTWWPNMLPDLVRPELTYCFLNWSYVAWPGLFVWYFDDVPLVEFIYTLYLHACQVSYHGRLRSLLLCLTAVFQALINSLVCWFGYFVYRWCSFWSAEEQTWIVDPVTAMVCYTWRLLEVASSAVACSGSVALTSMSRTAMATLHCLVPSTQNR